MRRSLIVALAAAALVAPAALLAGSHDAAAQPSTTTIQVGDLWFCDPSNQGGQCDTTIEAGDTVTWQFGGSMPHTSTHCPDNLDDCESPHLWDSGVVFSGPFSFTFDTPGLYLYRCQVHPFQMEGSITVAEAAEATATPAPSATATAQPGDTSPTPSDGGQAPAGSDGAGDPGTGDAASDSGGPASSPAGGDAPLSGGDSRTGWWIALAAGALSVVMAAALAARALRR